MAELTWSIREPGLTAFDRCGIGAMAASIDAAHRLKVDFSPLDASFRSDSVVLRWPDDVPPRDALLKLIEFAWQARQPSAPEGLGVLYLPAVHRGSAADAYPDRLLENNGILSTFLQHPRSQPKTKPQTRQVEVEEERYVEVRFLESKKKLKYVSDFSRKLFDPKGETKPQVDLAQFIMPGGTARHGGEESWTGSAIQAIPLFFAPIGCFFLRAQSFSWVIVVPDVSDLAAFVSARHAVCIGWKEAEIRSLEDAGLRVAVAYRTQTATRRLALRGLEVLRIGSVAWNRQAVRSSFCRLRPGIEELDEFEAVLRHLPNRYRNRKDGEGGFISVPTPRGTISANLAHGHYWYRSLFEIPKEDREEVKNQSRSNESEEQAWFRLIGYERHALIAIAEGEGLPMDANRELDRLFMDAIHEAMARRFRQEADSATRGARSVQERWEDFLESSRRLLGRSNTRSTLRTALAEFFADAGGSRTLRENAQAIWVFIDSPATWRRARDLALLSLVTYQAKKGQEEGEEADESSEMAVTTEN